MLEFRQFNGYLFKIVSMTAVLKFKMAALELWFYLSLKKISLESFQLWSGNKCIETLKVAKNLRINFVDGKHNLWSINHISSDLEGHQVQERNFKFGKI